MLAQPLDPEVHTILSIQKGGKRYLSDYLEQVFLTQKHPRNPPKEIQVQLRNEVRHPIVLVPTGDGTEEKNGIRKQAGFFFS